MQNDSDSATAFITNRFIVSHVHCERDTDPADSGYCGRDVYVAFDHTRDIPRPVCVVTLFGNYVEWIETAADYRRQGIATEVLHGLENRVGLLTLEPVTAAGEKFADHFDALF